MEMETILVYKSELFALGPDHAIIDGGGRHRRIQVRREHETEIIKATEKDEWTANESKKARERGERKIETDRRKMMITNVQIFYSRDEWVSQHNGT